MIEIYAANCLRHPKGNLHQGVRTSALAWWTSRPSATASWPKAWRPFISNDNAFFFYDPEGNVLHFVERPKPLGA